MLATLSVSVLIVLTTVFWNWNRIKKWLELRKKILNIPVAPMPALPLLGHSYLIVGTSSAYFHYVAERAVLMLQLYRVRIVNFWLGPVPLIIIADPDAAEVVLKGSKHIKKSMIYTFLHPWLGTGLLTAEGEKWKQRRRLITPSFHFDILQSFLEVMNEQTQIMISKLKMMESKEKNINLGNVITKCALDIICETAMGQSVQAQQEDDSKYVKSIYR